MEKACGGSRRKGRDVGDIKAIETHYKGYRFRSRLEARWAVFLDRAGIAYRYEPQGFDLDDLLYLPDFWLPVQKCWLEIKPKTESACYEWDERTRAYRQIPCRRSESTFVPELDFIDGATKARRLAEASGHPVVMLFDELAPLGFRRTTPPTHDDPGDFEIEGSNKAWWPRGGRWGGDGHDDGCVTWGECPLCGMLGLESHAQHEICACRCQGEFAEPDRKGDWPRCVICRASDPDRKGGAHSPWKESHSPRLMAAYKAARSARFEFGETPR